MLYYMLMMAAILGQTAQAPPATQPASQATSQPATTFDSVSELSGLPVQISTTPDGKLVLTGDEKDVEILAEFIKVLDYQPWIEPTFHIINLKHAQAAELAPKVEKFWNEVTKPITGKPRPEDRITIIPEARTNTLMVAATVDSMDKIKDIIDQLDQPTLKDEVRLYEQIPLKHIKVLEAEEMLNKMLEDLQKRRQSKTKLFDIKADVRTNSLLISAPEEDLKQIKHLIDLIDVETTEESWSMVKMAVFPLQKAVAKDLADTLETMLQSAGDDAKAMQEQIRRLQVMVRKADGTLGDEILADLDLDKPIKVFSDVSANAVIVASVESNLKSVGEIVRLLDTVPIAEDMLVKLFPLKYADAESLQKMLEDMFKSAKDLVKLPGRESKIPDRVPSELPGKSLVHNISLSSDPRTNMLVAAGQPDQLLLIEKVISAIDVPEHANRFPLRMIQLEHADVRRVAEIAEELAEMRQKAAKRIGPLAEEREQILVIPDVRTNSMIVVAKDDNYDEIVNLARKLDEMGKVPFGDIQIISLTNLAASEIVEKIEKLWERRAAIRKEEELPEDKPVLVADTRSNSLVVAASTEDVTAMKQLVEQLEKLELTPMADIRLVPLKHNDATKLAEIVEKLFEERIKISQAKGEEERPSERVAVVPEPLTNTLLIASTKPKYDEVMRLVEKLDVPLAVEGLIRTFFIQYADVTNTAELLDKMFEEGVYRGSAGDKDIPESITKVTIVPHLRSSSLIVSASPENFAIIEALLKEIDQEDTPMFKAEASFFKLQHADVVKVADILEQLFEGMQDTLKDEKEQLEVTLIPDMRSNVLIVAGTRLAMKRAAELVPKLDQPSVMPTSEVRVYKLKDAAASQLEPVMTELFEKRIPSDLKDKQTPIIVLPDDGSNSLVVTASTEDHLMVADLITKLDRKSTLAEQVEIISLEQARAEELAETLEDLLQQQQEGMKDAKGGFAITPEERTNSLLVWASPDMLSNIKTIVAQLDNVKSKTEMAMRVFKLYNADAEDLSELLEEFFEAAGAGDQEKSRQLIINFKTSADPKVVGDIIPSLVYQDVTIKPDTNTNSLLVMTPKDHIDMMQMLVEMLDSVEPLTAKVRMFTLYNADATEMKELLDELFQTQEGDSGQERRQLVIGGEGQAPMRAEGAASLDLAFSVDRRTNSLIAAGSEIYLKTVEKLVQDLDYQEIEERIVKVVPLRHVDAEDVAERMSAYFDEESSIVEEVEGEAVTRQMERRVTITDAGEVANTLLVSYSPRMESQVITMINELDQLPPSVMIQVLMAEVTLEDRFEMGMEFAVQDLLFSEKAVLGPNNTLQGDNFDFIMGTDIGAAGGTLGGFSFTVTGEDFNFLLRALQTEGRLEILSRPSILVQDQKEASITVGESIPIVKDFNVASTGSVTPSVDYQDVGIILTVTPIISPDGYVNMEIFPEISSIGTSSIPVAAGVNLPILNERKAETAVTVKDGETIIIGGLITSRENTSETKVPLLGDIPGLGHLFRTNTVSNTKTELLIVLTPHVIRDMDQARTISIEMRDQTGMLDNMRKNPLMQRLQVKPEEDQLGPVEPLRPIDRKKRDQQQLDQMGPALEEFGPASSSIEYGPSRSAIVIRAER
ncbi:MAG: hypothetical protein JSV03_17610 [Planctomycetota bacterium]|nr:MAG: hypothetical protein JSV03_17610 [Planctomycetota bacterium]